MHGVHEAAEGLLGRHALDKTYHGALDASGIGEMLSAGTETPGSAGYVAIEKVTGKLEGRRRQFSISCIECIMTRGQGSLTIEVIPDFRHRRTDRSDRRHAHRYCAWRQA
ncbi:MAG: DUF3224 domain-containing protein [Asticcacaulis sp.]